MKHNLNDNGELRHIRFPSKSVNLVEQEVRETLGISFNEFLRNIVIGKADEIFRRSNSNSKRADMMSFEDESSLLSKRKQSRNISDFLQQRDEENKKVFEMIDQESLE